MLTVKEALAQPLPLFEHRLYVNKNKNRGSPERILPRSVVSWDGFEGDMDRHVEQQNEPNEGGVDRLFNTDNVTFTFRDEVDVAFAVRQYLARAVEAAASSMQINITTDSSIPGADRVVMEPDHIVWTKSRRDTPQLLLPIVIRVPAGIREGDLRRQYVATRPEYGVANLLVQEGVGYMYRNRLEYGFITTYASSYALRLDSSGYLHMSRQFRYDEVPPTVVKALYYVIVLASQSKGYEGPTLDGYAPRTGGTTGTHVRMPCVITNDADTLSVADVKVGAMLKSRKGNAVVRGTTSTGAQVVLKTAKRRTVSEKRMVNEQKIYHVLRHVQGQAVPRVLGAGRGYLILEYCGEPLAWSTSRVVRRMMPRVQKAIDAVHKCGVFHADLALRNILCRDGQIRIIDFEDSYKVVDSSDLKDDVVELDNY